MKLSEIWISTAAWQALSPLKKDPKLAYRLLKYEKKVEREINACAKLRDKCLYEAAGVEAPTPPDVLVVQIPRKLKEADPANPGKEVEVDNPQYLVYVKLVNELMETESDLEHIDLTMDDLIEAISAKEGNLLAERDIELLQPFFKEPPA